MSPAVANALTAITRAFSNPQAGAIRRARRAIAAGLDDRENLTRYGLYLDLADAIGIAGAVDEIGWLYAAELEHHRRSEKVWRASRLPRLELMILAELRLIGRWLRRHHPRALVDVTRKAA